MSYARARSLEIPENRMIFIRGGATAWEPRDILTRDHYHGSVAMNAVLAAATKMSDKRSNGFDMVELYSCFPTVPKMARRSLGLSSSTPLTVTGGLTFFGPRLAITWPCGGGDGALRCAEVREGRPSVWSG